MYVFCENDVKSPHLRHKSTIILYYLDNYCVFIKFL